MMPGAKLRDRIAPPGSFRANMLIRMSGTAVAQVVILAVSPILTRLFSPEAFGTLGVFGSLVFVAACIVTLQYDQAIMLPKDDEDAAALLWAALLAASLVSAALLLGGLAFSRRIPAALGVEGISGWILLVPLAVFLQGVHAALISWSARQKKFARASVSQVARAASMSGVQLASGLLQPGPGGLIGGTVAGDGLGAAAAGWMIGRDHWRFLMGALARDRIRRAAAEYREFPLYSTACVFLNGISKNVPVFLLAKLFGPAAAGFYAVAYRVLQAPMNFVLIALRQVFFQKSSEEFNRDGDTYALFKRATAALLAMAAVPALLVVLFGPALFAFVLGAEWRIAGEYARWMILWLAFMFANVPASLFGKVLRKQRSLLLQNIGLFAFSVLAVVIGSWRRSPLLAVALYSLVGMVYNVYMILWAGNLLRKARTARRGDGAGS